MVFLKMKTPYKIGTRVETPDGHGVIISESKVGEFMIRLDGKGGMVFYYEEDLNIEQEEDDDET